MNESNLSEAPILTIKDKMVQEIRQSRYNSISCVTLSMKIN